jgi:hypothetical protein
MSDKPRGPSIRVEACSKDLLNAPASPLARGVTEGEGGKVGCLCVRSQFVWYTRDLMAFGAAQDQMAFHRGLAVAGAEHWPTDGDCPDLGTTRTDTLALW